MLNSLKPFLKWAGGKRWLTKQHPELFQIPFERYLEPFLGGGAVFFHMLPEKGLLSDLNPTLINTYQAIKENHREVVEKLRAHASLHSDSYYYEIRSKEFRSPTSRAAQFLYLNRTCWNGLYRENLLGKFNVPRGTKNTVLFDDDDFGAISKSLSNIELKNYDFEKAIQNVSSGDFVFVDPPYTVRHNSNGFLKYNEHIFSWADQVRLAAAIKRKLHSGASFLITNAHHDSIFELYKDFGVILSVKRASVLAGSKKFRGSTNEAIVLIGEAWANIKIDARLRIPLSKLPDRVAAH